MNYTLFKIINKDKILIEEEIKLGGFFSKAYNNMGHAKAIARIAFADSSSKDLQDIVVKDKDGNIVFKANEHSNGIAGKGNN